VKISILTSATATEERLFDAATRAASAAERAVQQLWSELLDLITRGGSMDHVYHTAHELLSSMPGRVRTSLSSDFVDIAEKTHAHAVANLAKHLPATITARPKTSEDERPKSMLQMLLPNPSPTELLRIIYDGDWSRRMQNLTSLSSPGTLAQLIAAGVSQNKTPAQIAREIRPAVQGVQSTARRVARTEGLRIAHEIQMNAYEGLGDMVIGYQVHAVLDRATRPEHRKRDKTIYYKRPKPGQKPMSECPKPPLEADGTYAFNCRCFLTPVFGDLDEIAPLPAPINSPT
jgi:SPP1 gp7 family putative phage head morphogenesis protein